MEDMMDAVDLNPGQFDASYAVVATFQPLAQSDSSLVHVIGVWGPFKSYERATKFADWKRDLARTDPVKSHGLKFHTHYIDERTNIIRKPSGTWW